MYQSLVCIRLGKEFWSYGIGLPERTMCRLIFRFQGFVRPTYGFKCGRQGLGFGVGVSGSGVTGFEVLHLGLGLYKSLDNQGLVDHPCLVAKQSTNSTTFLTRQPLAPKLYIVLPVFLCPSSFVFVFP